MVDRILHSVHIRGEFLEQLYRAVKADHSGFGCLPHHRLREDDSGLAHRRQQGLDVRAGFYSQHYGKRVAAQIEVLDFLPHAIVVHAEIIFGKIQDHFPRLVRHRHRRDHFIHSHTDRVLVLLGRSSRLLLQRTRRRLAPRRAGRSQQRQRQRNERRQTIKASSRRGYYALHRNSVYLIRGNSAALLAV